MKANNIIFHEIGISHVILPILRRSSWNISRYHKFSFREILEASKKKNLNLSKTSYAHINDPYWYVGGLISGTDL